MTLPLSGLPEVVGDDEPIARFLTQSGHFSRQRQLVSPGLFLPSNRDRETSVSRHGREPLEALRTLGLAAAAGRKLYGAAIIRASNVRSAQLEIHSAEPPERHAVIRGWPWDDNDPDDQKARQKEYALVLASAAGVPLLFNDGEAWKPAESPAPAHGIPGPVSDGGMPRRRPGTA